MIGKDSREYGRLPRQLLQLRLRGNAVRIFKHSSFLAIRVHRKHVARSAAALSRLRTAFALHFVRRYQKAIVKVGHGVLQIMPRSSRQRSRRRVRLTPYYAVSYAVTHWSLRVRGLCKGRLYGGEADCRGWREITEMAIGRGAGRRLTIASNSRGGQGCARLATVCREGCIEIAR